MLEKIKTIFKKITPIFIRRRIADFRYGFFGPYETWEEAKRKSTGYEKDLILDKVKTALLKVKNGEAAYERDSVIFQRKEYSWSLLTALFLAASKNSNKLSVLDFGGSLGTTYFQNLDFLKRFDYLSWNIVEQANFVACGKKNFADGSLYFYNSIQECLKKESPSIIIFSSVIQYLERPYDILKEAADFNFKYIVFDRTTFRQGVNDIITLQKVPPQVYDASYPCWFLSEEKFLNFFESRYNLIADFSALGGVVNRHGVKGEYKGFIFETKNKYV